MEQPKQIFKFEKEVIIRKTPMVLNSDGSWELSESYVEIHYDRIAKEWFEDENGVEVEMEENE